MPRRSPALERGARGPAGGSACTSPAGCSSARATSSQRRASSAPTGSSARTEITPAVPRRRPVRDAGRRAPPWDTPLAHRCGDLYDLRFPEVTRSLALQGRRHRRAPDQLPHGGEDPDGADHVAAQRQRIFLLTANRGRHELGLDSAIVDPYASPRGGREEVLLVPDIDVEKPPTRTSALRGDRRSVLQRRTATLADQAAHRREERHALQSDRIEQRCITWSHRQLDREAALRVSQRTTCAHRRRAPTLALEPSLTAAEVVAAGEES